MKTKHFKKDLVMIKENERRFRKANQCHICYKLYSEKNIRVKNHCQITDEYRSSDYQIFNANYRLTQKIPIIFHNLKGYNSNHIMQKIRKLKKNCYTKWNGKEYDFMLGKNLFQTDSMQFMNSNLENLFENLPKNKFKYLFL